MTVKRLNFESPYGCRWCGVEHARHGRRYRLPVGVHSWEAPWQSTILLRMRRRRAARLNAEPTLYHATTGWAADATGESGEPYCADCKNDGCRRWIRIQARLDQIRWGIPRNPRSSSGGWGRVELPF
ncbi:MAG: hypothetical protein HOY75_08215 [Streptomyces sp.]|nr:hypothetical protein [Streptomyces sp.]